VNRRYCGQSSRTNEQQECPRCEGLGRGVHEKLADGRLPRYSIREIGMSGKSIWETGGMCAACGKAIAEQERWLLRHIDRRQGHSEDRLFHDLCHDIWLDRAATE